VNSAVGLSPRHGRRCRSRVAGKRRDPSGQRGPLASIGASFMQGLDGTDTTRLIPWIPSVPEVFLYQTVSQAKHRSKTDASCSDTSARVSPACGRVQRVKRARSAFVLFARHFWHGAHASNSSRGTKSRSASQRSPTDLTAVPPLARAAAPAMALVIQLASASSNLLRLCMGVSAWFFPDMERWGRRKGDSAGVGMEVPRRGTISAQHSLSDITSSASLLIEMRFAFALRWYRWRISRGFCWLATARP